MNNENKNHRLYKRKTSYAEIKIKTKIDYINSDVFTLDIKTGLFIESGGLSGFIKEYDHNYIFPNPCTTEEMIIGLKDIIKRLETFKKEEINA